MRKTLMYLVRHGTTTDSGKKIFRGQRDSALDKAGFRDAHALKTFFSKVDWHRLFCSKMTRSVQTAEIICGDVKDCAPEVIDGLEPWDIGVLTGQPKNEENSKLIKYFDTHLSEAPEDGESIYHFEGRVWPVLAALIQLGWEQGIPCVVVAHSSVVHTLNHLLVGHFNHKEIAVAPGGIIEVYMENGEILHEPVFKQEGDDSSFSAGDSSLERS